MSNLFTGFIYFIHIIFMDLLHFEYEVKILILGIQVSMNCVTKKYLFSVYTSVLDASHNSTIIVESFEE